MPVKHSKQCRVFVVYVEVHRVCILHVGAPALAGCKAPPEPVITSCPGVLQCRTQDLFPHHVVAVGITRVLLHCMAKTADSSWAGLPWRQAALAESTKCTQHAIHSCMCPKSLGRSDNCSGCTARCPMPWPTFAYYKLTQCCAYHFETIIGVCSVVCCNRLDINTLFLINGAAAVSSISINNILTKCIWLVGCCCCCWRFRMHSPASMLCSRTAAVFQSAFTLQDSGNPQIVHRDVHSHAYVCCCNSGAILATCCSNCVDILFS